MNYVIMPTCHWCHVMEEESFEDQEVAELLNRYFVSIKVDKEERPDIDSIYMSVCMAVTGSGGWPLTIIMTPEQKPFFAGTYIPKKPRYNMHGLMDLLFTIHKRWDSDQESLEKSAQKLADLISGKDKEKDKAAHTDKPKRKLFQKAKAHQNSDSQEGILSKRAYHMFCRSFDKAYGGFGAAPKFPTAHNLLFLLNYYQLTKEHDALAMAETTLLQMYRGGIYDHIGFGFSRYSTDEYWLIPHFEKMLYDNALLILAYTEAFALTGTEFYATVAARTMAYVKRELQSQEGGFFCAQDADSDGVEGKYYAFVPDEILQILGAEKGSEFNAYFNISPKGNFEGKSIANLLQNKDLSPERYKEHYLNDSINQMLPAVLSYRDNRTKLHKDDKILSSWNGMMIAAFARAGRFLDVQYMQTAFAAMEFLEKNLMDEQGLYVSWRDGKRKNRGFLDDYAFVIWAYIELYESTWDCSLLDKALNLAQKVVGNFWDTDEGGFFLYGKDNEQLLFKPKEVYDGAVPSGNSVMAYALCKLSHITRSPELEEISKAHQHFMQRKIAEYPAGHCFYLLSYLLNEFPQKEVVVVLKEKEAFGNNRSMPKDEWENNRKLGSQSIIRILAEPTKEYPLKDNKTTYYVCENLSCKPPTNDLYSVT